MRRSFIGFIANMRHVETAALSAAADIATTSSVAL